MIKKFENWKSTNYVHWIDVDEILDIMAGGD